MTKTRERVQKIRKQIEEKAQQKQPYEEITEATLDRAIEDHAGWNSKTKRQYKKIMQERKIIKRETNNRNFKIIKWIEDEEQETKDIDYTAPKKNVTVTINRDLIEQANALNVNKSELFEKTLIKKISNLEQKIKTICDEDEEDIGFIEDLILEDAFFVGKNAQRRKELYVEHFGMFNEFACEQLRKSAVKVAEELGIIEKPEGL